MVHRLNTNKQFMIGNGLLAFAIIVVIAIFVYLSFKGYAKQNTVYTEAYSITLLQGFVGDSVSVYINDSLLLDTRIDEEPVRMDVNRFDEHNTLMIVDNLTEEVSLFELSEKGGAISLAKENGGIRLLAN